MVRFGKNAEFWLNWGATLLRASCGLLVATAVGVTLGVLMGLSAQIYQSLIPVVDFFRSTPVTTLYPIFVLVVGIGDLSKISMIATACVFIVALNAAYGVSHSSQTRRLLARLYGASKWQVFSKVVLMEALPQILVGLRVSVSLALIVAILVEMFMGADLGLGQRIMESYAIYAVDRMYALILLTGLTGYLCNRAFEAMERRLVPWVGVRAP